MHESAIKFLARLDGQLYATDRDGLLKSEHLLTSGQGAEIVVRRPTEERRMLNLCSNNYLGLAGDNAVRDAAQAALERYGVGMASVRFICGTLELHKELETAVADYVRQDDAILFAACFDANGGVFEPLFDDNDAIISDALNHASIIDGMRLCKARRYRYANGDMDDLERKLAQSGAEGARTKVIVTDGVFSMVGSIARLNDICSLADRHGALVMIDDCHATGVLGRDGRGSAEHCGVEGRIDIVTGTFGKALGGAMGGFVAGRKQIVDTLRQRSRPYLFSNSLAPALTAASLKAIEISRTASGLRENLFDNTKLFRKRLERAGFNLLPGKHPIVPLMIGDAKKAQTMASLLLDEGIYVTSFSYPVVPQGQACIRTQLSAAHTPDQLDAAAKIFSEVGKHLGVV
jgi:glycine C-acetyltransferase